MTNAQLERLIPTAQLNKGSRISEPACWPSSDEHILDARQVGQTLYICGELQHRHFANNFLPATDVYHAYERGWLRERADCAEVCNALARAERRGQT